MKERGLGASGEPVRSLTLPWISTLMVFSFLLVLLMLMYSMMGRMLMP